MLVGLHLWRQQKVCQEGLNSTVIKLLTQTLKGILSIGLICEDIVPHSS